MDRKIGGPTHPKLLPTATTFIRLDGYVFIYIIWVVLGQQSWVCRRLQTPNDLSSPQTRWVEKSADLLLPPKVLPTATTSIRLDGYLFIDISWVVLGQQSWVCRRQMCLISITQHVWVDVKLKQPLVIFLLLVVGNMYRSLPVYSTILAQSGFCAQDPTHIPNRIRGWFWINRRVEHILRHTYFNAPEIELKHTYHLVLQDTGLLEFKYKSFVHFFPVYFLRVEP